MHCSNCILLNWKQRVQKPGGLSENTVRVTKYIVVAGPTPAHKGRGLVKTLGSPSSVLVFPCLLQTRFCSVCRFMSFEARQDCQTPLIAHHRITTVGQWAPAASLGSQSYSVSGGSRQGSVYGGADVP